jgi:hypothetical protein
MANFNFGNFDFSQFDPRVIQNALKMLNYIQNNMQSMQKILSEDPDLTSPEATQIVNELGAIKYPNKSYLDRQRIVKEELKELLPEFREKLR